MRAVAVSRFRARPELMELPVPEPGPAELLVRVEFAGINPFDWKIADGILEGRRPHVFPLVLGVDGAGTVESKDSSHFRAGDRVTGQFLHDPVGIGTYAEFATVPERIGIIRVPDAMATEAAAALPTAGMTALDSLEILGLTPGQSLVVVGASGGVGSFVVELAVAQGIRVTAVARSSSDARLRGLGAEQVIDPTQGDAPALLQHDHPSGVDGLLDLMSDRAGFSRWASCVRRGGAAATTTYVADPGTLAQSGVRAVNIDLQPNAALLERLVGLIQERHLAIPVERTVSLAEAPAAVAELKAGRGQGKTVIRLGP